MLIFYENEHKQMRVLATIMISTYEDMALNA